VDLPTNHPTRFGDATELFGNSSMPTIILAVEKFPLHAGINSNSATDHVHPYYLDVEGFSCSPSTLRGRFPVASRQRRTPQFSHHGYFLTETDQLVLPSVTKLKKVWAG